MDSTIILIDADFIRKYTTDLFRLVINLYLPANLDSDELAAKQRQHHDYVTCIFRPGHMPRFARKTDYLSLTVSHFTGNRRPLGLRHP